VRRCLIFRDKIRAVCKGWKHAHGDVHNFVTKPDREEGKLVMRGMMTLKCVLIMSCAQMFVIFRDKIELCVKDGNTHGGVHNFVTKSDREEVKLVMRGMMTLKCVLIMSCAQMFVIFRDKIELCVKD